jgi:hypothetical protein
VDGDPQVVADPQGGRINKTDAAARSHAGLEV